MKTVLIPLLIILTGLSNYTYAQVAFPTANANWCFDSYGDYGGFLGRSCSFPSGTVQVGGHTYTSTNDGFLYRESNRQLFVLPQDSVNEYLVYDFNLMVGDTFNTVQWHWNGPNIEMYVVNVDTFTTFDGIDRKRIWLQGNSYLGIWIEGIGAVHYMSMSVFKPSYVFSVSGWSDLACHSVGNTVIYGAGSSPSSCILSSVEKVDNTIEVQIFPNPVDEQLTIELKNAEIQELFITDLNGRIILRQSINNLQQVSIPFEGALPSGVYLVKLATQEGEFLTRKFVKI